MSSKNTSFENLSIPEYLNRLNEKKLRNLLATILSVNPETKKTMLRWLNANEFEKGKNDSDISQKNLDEETLWETWSDARAIISEFNEYGGGPDDELDECSAYFQEILELAEKGKISTETKFKLMNEIFEEYNVGNSGFDDSMMDICYAICRSNEEWHYLVKKLGEKPSDWRNKLIMDLQKNNLKDDSAYLELRTKKLHYGMDYWDLTDYFSRKGDMISAVETAEKGLKNGEGRLTELFMFLYDYYAKKDNIDDVTRIVNHAIIKRSDEREMLEKLFHFYKNHNDYENAKKTLLKKYEYISGPGHIPEVRSYKYYKVLKNFVTDADWMATEKEIIEKIKIKDPEDYIRICLDKNLKKEALDILLNPPEKRNEFGSRFTTIYSFDEFAEKLQKDFPLEIIKFFWDKAYSIVKNTDRNAYRSAANYLKKVKFIFIGILNNKSEWEKRLSELKTTFYKHKAFLKELGNL